MGCVFFSLAVSVKMNILLFAPGLLCLLLQVSETWIQTLGYLSICASIQLLLGAPFLLTFPLSYLRKAFELDRVFAYEWTVNLKVSTANIYSISFPFCRR
jgi:alpha-1,3-mannosyltransferase